MKAHQNIFCIEQMARTLGVSRSGYYDFLKRPKSFRSLANKKLLENIQDIFEESHYTYGSPRVHAELVSRGFKCSRPLVGRLMKTYGLRAKMHRKFIKTTNRSILPGKELRDLVKRQFQVEKPNRVWVADITYIKINHAWAYLAVVLDLFSRKIVGMALQENMKTTLVLQALQQALILRNPPQGLIHHSDLGTQYTSSDMNKMAQRHYIKLSYGNSAFDNAVMESFFHTLKTEHVYFKKYQSIEEAKTDIFTYIFTFYNSKRRHSTLKYNSPDAIEKMYQQHQNSIYVHTVR